MIVCADEWTKDEVRNVFVGSPAFQSRASAIIALGCLP
jgi:hypothetical protein